MTPRPPRPPPDPLWSIYFPVLYPGGLARRLLRENPDWPESIPFAMVDDRRRRVTELFGYGPVLLARSGGLTPQGLVALFDGVATERTHDLPLREAVARLLQHVSDFEARRAAEQAAQDASTDDEGP